MVPGSRGRPLLRLENPLRTKSPVFQGVTCPFCLRQAQAVTTERRSRTSGDVVITTYWHGTAGCASEIRVASVGEDDPFLDRVAEGKLRGAAQGGSYHGGNESGVQG